MEEKKLNFIERWKTKSLFSKITDFIFIGLIVAMLIPQSRMAIGAFVNRIKSKIIQPKELAQEKKEVLNESDLNFSFVDVSGKTRNFSEYKGKVIFLNFWATWCPPCVGEMPSIQELYDKYKNNDKIAFVLISDESPELIKAFTAKKSYTFPVFSMNSNLPEQLSTSGIPATFLITKKGEIALKEVGAADWSGDNMIEIVEKLIKE